MLNLNELEKKLDAALEKESKESITNWILSKRRDKINSFLGEGEFEVIVKKASSMERTKEKELSIISKENIAVSINYSFAA